MPQLDTIHTLMTFIWTWLMLHLTAQKIKTFTMTKQMTTTNLNKYTPTMQWL